MNRVGFVLSALSGVAAVGVLVLIVRTWRTPVAHPVGLARVEQMAGIALLALGAAVFAISAFTPNEDMTGPALLPPALLLAATGVLAWRQPALAGRLLLWSAAIVVPLTFVLGILVGGSDPDRPGSAVLNNATGGVVFAMLYAIPAAITGVLLNQSPTRAPDASGRWQASPR